MRGAIWSAASIALGKAWLCTGRNIAYRRDVWLQVSGFSKLMQSVSGDDDLFLQLVRKTTKWKIRYVVDPLSFVPTAPPPSFRAFLEQRKRHFSAGSYFSLPMKLFFFVFHASNLLLFVGLILGVLIFDAFQIGIWLYMVKLSLDFMLIVRGSAILQEDHVNVHIVPMEILYLFYNTFIGPLGFFASFKWKPDLKS